jgi:hypothetical protein
MFQTHKARWGAAAVGLVAVAAGGFWLALRAGDKPPPRPLKTWDDIKAERHRLLDEWKGARAVPILSGDLDKVIDQVIADEGMPLPPGGKLFDRKQLTANQRDDFAKALRGLLQTYAKGTVDDILAYMAERDEALPPEEIRQYRKDLAEVTHKPAGEVDRLSWRDLLRDYYAAIKYQPPGWQAVLQGQGGVTFWTVAQVPGGESFGEYYSFQRDNLVFKNIVSCGHRFRTTGTPLPDVIKQKGQVLIADVRVLVKYTVAKYGEPRPHYVRFWYDPVGQKWHPQGLAFVCTVTGDAPLMIF